MAESPPSRRSLTALALRLLARRERSRAELRLRLLDTGAPAGEVDAVMAEVEARGWLNEARCAEQVLASAAGRYGPRRLEQKLRARQIAPDTLEALRARLGEDELEHARALVARRYAGPPADLRERARRARFLAGRGFGSAVIARVLGPEPYDP